MKKILVNDGISKIGVKILEKSGFKVIDEHIKQDKLKKFINEEDIEVLLVRSATKVNKELINHCPNLKIIGRGGVGMDNIDVKYAKKNGIKVINTPAASSASVAELVFTHLFNMARFIHESNREMPLDGERKFKELKKKYSKGSELRGKKLGIIGFGRIGQEVAKIGIGLGMQIMAHDKFIKKSTIEITFFNTKKLSFEIKTKKLKDVLQESDFITCHVPKKKEQALIGKKEFKIMKDGVCIVNAARGGVINEYDLIQAIETGKVNAAGLDVFENEPKPSVKLLMNEKISLSPHIGGSTIEAQNRIGLELAEQIINFYN
jgi:D-3-phosphoglycerate dehydrogenase